MAKIRIKHKDGKVVVEAQGFEGETCRKFTSSYTKAMGQVTSDTPTAEAYETVKETEQRRELA